jgi:hypothetical protein
VSETGSPSPKRLWRATAGVMLLALPLLGCTPTTNDPDTYGAITEANVLDGCIRAGREDPGDERVVEVDDKGDNDDANDEVRFIGDVSDAEREACECLYDGMVDELDFQEFEDLDADFREIAEAAEDDSDTTTTRSRVVDTVVAIAGDCSFPPR